MTTASVPMNATITGGTITVGDQQPVSFTMSIPEYHGDPLYCKLLISDFTLAIFIDNEGPSSLGPFNIDKKPDKVAVIVRSQARHAAWVGELMTPYSGDELEFALELSPGLNYATLAIRPLRISLPEVSNANDGLPVVVPASPAVVRTDASPGLSDADLGYIAVEVEDQPGTLQLFFIDPPPTITNYTRLTTATIVPPAPLSGSIGGPMGIQLNS